MSIVKGQVATYKDLVDNLINGIAEICDNIGSISENVPEELKTGYSEEIYRETYQIRGASKGGCGYRYTPPLCDHTSTVTFKLNDEKCPTEGVSLQQVKNQFENFMISRGVYSKSDTIMSMRGILNFYANAACFVKAKIYQLTGNETDRIFTYYDENNTNFPEVTEDSESISDVDYITMSIDDMNTALNNIDRFHCAKYDVALTCCSSSSSSSSSSCSSSCSSSTLFIAFMKL